MSESDRLVADRYRLQERIGGGGMGAVWLARDERLGRQVAVKQVLPPSGADESAARDQRERAMREGRIAARLSHPHAISVYDVALEDGQPWLVMEYLPSRSLSAVLAEDGVLRVDQVAQIGAQVADALAATHAAGIVHRDVKPANILIGQGGRVEGLVKITDFGISHASGDVTLTQTGQITGTPAYLAPEVAQGLDPGPAADVFSLGATLYTCLEGEPPFGMAGNSLQQLYRVAAGGINPPQRCGALTAPLLRMLSSDPTARPSMTEVRDDLAALVAGQDGDTTTVLTARTDVASSNRNRTSIFPAGAGAGGAAAAGAAAGAAMGAAAAAADEARHTPPEQAEPPGRTDQPKPAEQARPTPSPPPSPTPPPSPPPAPAPAKPAAQRTPPPRVGPPPVVAPPEPGGDERRRRIPKTAVLAAAVVAVLAGLVVFWTLVLSDPDGTSASPDGPGTSEPADPTDGATGSDTGDTDTGDTDTGDTGTADTGTGDGNEGDGGDQGDGGTETRFGLEADDADEYLDEYHELVLDDPDAAYEQAGDTLRSSISLEGFREYWGGVRGRRDRRRGGRERRHGHGGHGVRLPRRDDPGRAAPLHVRGAGRAARPRRGRVRGDDPEPLLRRRNGGRVTSGSPSGRRPARTRTGAPSSRWTPSAAGRGTTVVPAARRRTRRAGSPAGSPVPSCPRPRTPG